MNESRNILQYLRYHPLPSRGDISTGTAFKGSNVTLKHMITAGIKVRDIAAEGEARTTHYRLSPRVQLLVPLSPDTYFALKMDKRRVQRSYGSELVNDLLTETRLFSDREQAHLNTLQDEFRQHINELTDSEYHKEMERLGIDLSWKSSQMEGDTYTLLETERLLRESKAAKDKSKEETVMLLNHKNTLNFVLDNPDYLQELTVSHMGDIHQLLTKDLSIDRDLHRHRVDTTGTNYHPLDNEFQTHEAMKKAYKLIDSKSNIFERALLTLVLLSYIQPSSDRNKRTTRITSNTILVANDYCPLSFRSVDSIDYKKTMLVFYRQNGPHAFKQIFMEQLELAVKEYF